MFEAYAIGVTLKLNNLVSPQLLELAAQTERLDGLVVGLNKTLTNLRSSVPGIRQVAAAGRAIGAGFERAAQGVAVLEGRLQALRVTPGAASLVGDVAGLNETAGGVRRVGNALERAARHALTLNERLAALRGTNRASILPTVEEFERLDVLVTGLNRSLGAVGSTAPGIRRVAQATDALSRAMDRAANNTSLLERHLAALRAGGPVPGAPAIPLPAPGGGGRVPPRGGGGNHQNGPFHGGNIHMGPGGVGIGTVGMAAGDAFVPLAVTGAMVWGAHSLYESAKDLNTEMQRFKLFGLSDKLNQEAFSFVAGMKAYGLTQAENMRNFRESQGVFRESGMDDAHALEAAKTMAPILGQIDFASKSLDSESASKVHTQKRAMIRWIEMSGGLQSPEKAMQLANMGFKLTQTSGGTVNWEQLRQFRAIGGVAVSRMTEEAIAEAEPLIGELTGGRAANGLRTAMSRLSGVIRIPNQVAHHLVKQGIWDSKMVEFNANGGIKRFTGNPFKTLAQFQENQAEWYFKNIMPMYARMKLSDAEMEREDAMIFGNTGAAYFGLARRQRPTMQNSLSAYHTALGLDRAQKVGKESLSGQEEEFNAAWKDFKTQFGNTMLPTFSALLKDGSVVLRFIGDWLRDHEETVRLFKFFAGHLDSLLNPMGRLFPAASDLISPDGQPSPARRAWNWATGQGQPAVDTVKPAAASAPINVHTQVKLDGHTMASVVSRHQARAASMPLSAGTQFDPTMSPTPVLAR